MVTWVFQWLLFRGWKFFFTIGTLFLGRNDRLGHPGIVRHLQNTSQAIDCSLVPNVNATSGLTTCVNLSGIWYLGIRWL